MMPFIELTVGIVVGFGLGVLIMIMLDAREHNSSNNYVEIEDYEDQVHESGFIDIPAQRMYKDAHDYTPEVSGGFQHRIERFKTKNRFYR